VLFLKHVFPSIKLGEGGLLLSFWPLCDQKQHYEIFVSCCRSILSIKPIKQKAGWQWLSESFSAVTCKSQPATEQVASVYRQGLY